MSATTVPVFWWALLDVGGRCDARQGPGVPKTLVSYLIRWAAETVFKDEPEVARALASVLATPISPELRRLDAEGAITQKSEEIVGPYELHDFFLYWLLRFGFGPRRIARMGLHAFAGRHTLADIRHWLIVFLRRFFQYQFKRSPVRKVAVLFLSFLSLFS